jgi:hypothetical protein
LFNTHRSLSRSARPFALTSRLLYFQTEQTNHVLFVKYAHLIRQPVFALLRMPRSSRPDWTFPKADQSHQRPLLLTHVVWAPGAYLVPRRDGRLLVGATVEEKGYDMSLTAGGMLTLRKRPGGRCLPSRNREANQASTFCCIQRAAEDASRWPDVSNSIAPLA